MGHGGKRPGAGKKPKKASAAIIAAAPALTNDLAQKLWLDEGTEKRWRELRDAKDQWLRFAVEKEIAHQACGKPGQAVKIDGDNNKIIIIGA